MSKVVKYDHASIQEVEPLQFKDIDPAEVDFSKVRRTASVIKKYLQSDDKDPYTICVKARAAMNSVSECIRVAAQLYGFYHAQSKRYFSIAKIEKADGWFKKNKPDAKLTDNMRNTYAEMDNDYLTAKGREYAAKALLEYLRNKHGDFEHDLNLAKKKMTTDVVDESKAGYDNLSNDEEYDG